MRTSLIAVALVLISAPLATRATDRVWTNALGGSWSGTNNWSPNGIPAASDRVFMTNAAGVPVTLTNAATVDSLFLGTVGGAQALTVVSNAQLTVSTLFQLGGGALQGAGQLTVAGHMDWSAGRMVGPGLTRVLAGATLSIASGATDAPDLAGRRLDNAGSIDWAGRLAADGGAAVNNLPGSLFQVRTNGALAGSWTFNNGGTFQKTAGGGVLTLAGTFNNTNRVDVQAGTLALSGGGLHSGIFAIANGASLALVAVGPASHHVVAGGRIQGDNVFFGGVPGASSTNLVIQVDGTYQVAGITTIGPGVTADFTAAASVTELGTNVFVNGGGLNLDTAQSLAVTNLLLRSGTLSGSNTLSVLGTLTWTNSAILGAGTLNALGLVTIDATNQLIGWTLNNRGRTFWSSGSLATGGGSAINSAVGATFELVSGVALTDTGGTANVFNNAGFLRATNGPGTSTISGTFTNSGTVELDAGTVSFSAGFHQATGATLLVGGNLAAPIVDVAGGTFEGSGLITGSVSNNATVRLGQDRPPLTITGDFLQSTNGILFVDLPMLVLKTNSLIVGGSASLSGLITNCLNCLVSGFVLPARTNYAFLTLTNPIGATLQNNLALTFPSNQIGLAVQVINDDRLVAGSLAAVIAVVNTPPFFGYNDLGHIPELVAYVTNLVASDADVPAQAFTFTLVSGPAGLALAPSGQITWTPSECQGPGNFTATILVTDDGTPPLSITTNLVIAVDEVNQPPFFTPIPSLTSAETTLFSYQIVAIDPDCPTNSITYALSNAPPGMAIDPTSGLVTWLPDGKQGGSNFVVNVFATDTNLATLPPSSATVMTNFTLQVLELNLAPVFVPIAPRYTNVETLPFTLLLTAFDTNDPPNQLSFQILNGPVGMTNISISTNVVSSIPGTNFPIAVLTNVIQLVWTPGELDGPGTNIIQVRVTDNGVPPLSATQSLILVILETNSAPVWTNLFSTNLNEGVTLTLNLSNYVFDADFPANSSLTFTQSPPVLGVTLVNGVLTFTPDETQGGSVVTIPLTVTDNNLAAISTDRHLTVATNLVINVDEVNSAPVITLVGSTNLIEGVTGTIQFRVFDSDIPANPFSYVVTPLSGSLSTNLTLSVSNGTNIVLQWTPSESEGPGVYPMTLSVTDTNVLAVVNPSLTTSLNFTILIAETNRPPLLTTSDTNAVVTTNFSAAEGSLLNILLTGSDSDLPANTLTFSLTNQPLGMTITNVGTTNAVISWIPAENQGGPSNFVFQVSVSDGIATYSTNVHVTVLEVNNYAPQFIWPIPGVTNYFVAAATYNGNGVVLSASDPDIPPKAITFALTNLTVPAYLVTVPTTRLRWTALPTSGPFPVSAVATDAGSPPLSSTNHFTLTYVGSNTPPSFVQPAAGASYSVRTNTLLTIPFQALDLDLPVQTLTYFVVGSWPAGATLSGNQLTWRPATNQVGPHSLAVRVRDSGSPSISVTQTFTIKVQTGADTAPFFTLTNNTFTFLELTNNGAFLSATDLDAGDSVLFSLVSPPTGLAIDPTTGALSWTPDSGVGPSTNQVSVQVTDESGVSATTNIFIIVREANTAPIFSPAINGASYSVLTNAPLCLSFSAVDLDIPTNNTVDIALVSGPPGAVFLSSAGTNSAAATLCWTNAGVIGTNTFTLLTWDTNTLDLVHPHLTNSATFSIIVRSGNNTAPVLTVINPNLTIVEQTANLLTNVTVTDADLPANLLQFTVTATNVADQAPVSNIGIDPNTGVVSWTPTEAQGPGNYVVTVEVYDDGFPALTNRVNFNVAVLEANLPPNVDPVTSPQIFPEGVATTLAVNATDDDLPAQILSYAVRATNVLTGVAVTNMTIDGTGTLSWTPTEAQGPSTNFVVVDVWDNDPTNPLTNSIVFTNIATEVNLPPVFLSPSSGTTFCVTTGAVFVVTNIVLDPDVPSNTLSFTTTFPAGAVLTTSSVTGATQLVITWTNTLALGATQHFTLVVADTNEFDLVNPSYSATNDLVVIGLPDNPTPPTLTVLASTLNLGTNVTSVISNVFASDPDTNSILQFALISVVETNTLASAISPVMNPANGVITWPHSGAERPGTYRVDLAVTNPGCSTYVVATNFLVNLATNYAPAVSFPASGQLFSNSVGQAFILTVLATDDTTASTNLVYVLQNPPTNDFTFTNGIFTWTPVVDQLGSNGFAIQISDTNTPPGTVTVPFSVQVEPAIGPFAPAGPLVPAGALMLQVALRPGLTYNLQVSLESPPRTNWTTVQTLTATNALWLFPIDSERLRTQGAIFYRALVKP